MTAILRGLWVRHTPTGQKGNSARKIVASLAGGRAAAGAGGVG
jgi:hypothetical protein